MWLPRVVQFVAHFHFLHWCFSSLASGRLPAVREDGKPFGPGDGARAAGAGQPLGFKAALIYLKADLAEYAHTLGFPSTASHDHPCFLCTARYDQLVRLDTWDALTLPWPGKSTAEYEAACGQCEKRRVIRSAHIHNQLRALLEFDKRKGTASARGLALKNDYPPL